MLNNQLQGLQLRSVYAFDKAITLYQKYGLSRLFDSVTWYRSEGEQSLWISGIAPFQFLKVSKNACGITPFSPDILEKREINKERYFRSNKISIAELAMTNQDWMEAEIMRYIDAAREQIDQTIISATSGNANVQKDAGAGSKLVNYTQDGVVVIDATTGDGFTREVFQKVRTTLENQTTSVGGNDRTTLVITPDAYAQLRNSYGNELIAFNYDDEFRGSGSKVIDGINIVVLPPNLFPRDGNNYLGAAYNKSAIGMTIVPLNRVRYDTQMPDLVRNNQVSIPRTIGQYVPSDILGMPSITQEALMMNDFVIQMQFLMGATRIDPKATVVIKLKAS